MTSKRDDGFHNIETCFYPVPWNDVLEIIPAETISFTNSGITIPGKAEENLCLKAYYILADDFKLSPVSIHLHKIIPMGAGLGGGSSDGAHALKILNEIFELGLSGEQLAKYALRLGSDCPFFIQEKPMIGRGRGELLSPIEISLRGKYIVVIKPPIHVSTADAYRSVKPASAETSVEEILKNRKIEAWKNVLINDFEEVVFLKYPQIENIKDQLYHEGALYACMSGSGSSVFGIFEAPVSLKSRFQDQIYWSGVL